MRSMLDTTPPVDLDISKSHCRPHAYDHNQSSDSRLRTAKHHHPGFLKHFGWLEVARRRCRRFFSRCNTEDWHPGIGYLTSQAMRGRRARYDRRTDSPRISGYRSQLQARSAYALRSTHRRTSQPTKAEGLGPESNEALHRTFMTSGSARAAVFTKLPRHTSPASLGLRGPSKKRLSMFRGILGLPDSINRTKNVGDG